MTIVALGAGGSLPQSSANATNPVIGVDFSAGMSAAVSQLNAALGTNLQFSNPSGTVLQVLNNGGSNTVNSLSATSTVTSLSSGSSQLPLFTDSNGAPITGAITAERLANDGPGRTDRGQPGGGRLALELWSPIPPPPPRAIRHGRTSCSIR